MAEEPRAETLLSPEEMQYWLKLERKRAQIAARRRIIDATALVERYNAGELSAAQANEQMERHEARWGLGAEHPEATLQHEVDEAIDQMHRQRINETPQSGRQR